MKIIEVNEPPSLQDYPTIIAVSNEPFLFNLSASDPDTPANRLTYSFIDNPWGATLDATGGFRWTAPSKAGIYAFDVRVTDDGNPPLSDSARIKFQVVDQCDVKESLKRVAEYFVAVGKLLASAAREIPVIACVGIQTAIIASDIASAISRLTPESSVPCQVLETLRVTTVELFNRLAGCGVTKTDLGRFAGIAGATRSVLDRYANILNCVGAAWLEKTNQLRDLATNIEGAIRLVDVVSAKGGAQKGFELSAILESFLTFLDNKICSSRSDALNASSTFATESDEASVSLGPDDSYYLWNIADQLRTQVDAFLNLAPFASGDFENQWKGAVTLDSRLLHELEQDSLPPVSGDTFFRLTNLATGFQQSGRLDQVGQFNGIALAPRSAYTVEYVDPDSFGWGASAFFTEDSGTTVQIPRTTSIAPFVIDTNGDGTGDVFDSDGDGIPDDSEAVIGTDPKSRDTNADGVSDAAAIRAGIDPLAGRALPAGVIATVPLLGEARSVVLEGSPDSPAGMKAYLAMGSAGLAIVDAASFQQPIVLSQLDLPGNAVDVSVDSRLGVAAVATTTGLQLVNVSDPFAPNITRSLNVPATQVEIADSIVYVAAGCKVARYLLHFRTIFVALLNEFPPGIAGCIGLEIAPHTPKLG